MQQVQQHSRTGSARADTTNALGRQRKQQGWVLTLKPRIKSGGKARRGEYVAGPGARGGGTLPTLYCRSVVVAGSRLRRGRRLCSQVAILESSEAQAR